MINKALTLALGTTLLAAGGCNQTGGNASGNVPEAQTPKAQKEAGTKTIAAGLAPSSQFMADAKGNKATITQGDEQFTNGVVHRIDAVLMPSKPAAGPAVGQKAGK